MSLQLGGPGAGAGGEGLLGGGDRGMSGRQPQAVRLALAALEAVGELGPGATARQVAQHLRLSPGSTYRVLNVLVEEGCLVRMPDLSGFALGHRLLALVDPAPPSVPHAARAEVAALRAGVRSGVHLVVFTARGVVVVDPDPDHPPPPDAEVAAHLASTAVGLLLAREPRDAADRPGAGPGGERAGGDGPGGGGPDGVGVDGDGVDGDGVDGDWVDGDWARQTGWPDARHGCLAVAVRSVGGALVGALALAAAADQLADPSPHLPRLRACATRLGPLLA